MDSFKYLPSSMKNAYKNEENTKPIEIPFSKFTNFENQKVALITTAGIWDQTKDDSFEYEKEKQNPTWGDPDFRMIHKEIQQRDVGAGHLHINNEDILKDFNIVLPINPLKELEKEGGGGRVAETHYSFMGYQGYPADLSGWLTLSAPRVLEHLKQEGVTSLIFTPTWPECCKNVSGLARYFEKQGFSTIVVTMMPFWSKLKGIPRTISVEFPFGHPFGLPFHRHMQKEILTKAFDMLMHAQEPGEVWELDIEWPQTYEEAYVASHPIESSPIIGHLREKKLKEVHQRRRQRTKKETKYNKPD